MAVYFYALVLTILIISCLRVFHRKNFWGEFLVAFIGALPLSAVAGLRSLTIGTDLLVYGDFNFRMAQRYQDLSTYYTYIKGVNNTEYGYAALNFVVSRFTNNLSMFLFILALFTLVPIFIGSMKMESVFKVPVVIQVFLYFSVFYGLSLNEMRQVLAIGWVYLSVSILFQKGNYKWLKAIIIWAIAFSFHRTAIMGLIIFAMYYLFVTTRAKKWVIVRRSTIILVSLMAVFVGIMMLKSGNLPDTFSKYAQYIDGTNSFGSKNIGPFRIFSMSLFPIISMLVILIVREKKELIFSESSISIKSKNVLLFFAIILLFDIILILGGIRSAILPRIGQYFEIFEILLIPFSINISVSKKGRWIFYVILISYYLFIFVYITRSGENQIYPYQWIFGNNY